MDENMTQKYAYYVPVAETLNSLVQSDLWKNSRTPDSEESNVEVLRDICDGQNFKLNRFFTENPQYLKLVLYQDAFEMVNPSGSAKKKQS